MSIAFKILNFKTVPYKLSLTPYPIQSEIFPLFAIISENFTTKCVLKNVLYYLEIECKIVSPKQQRTFFST
jgi:hypothetical protein